MRKENCGNNSRANPDSIREAEPECGQLVRKFEFKLQLVQAALSAKGQTFSIPEVYGILPGRRYDGGQVRIGEHSPGRRFSTGTVWRRNPR